MRRPVRNPDVLPVDLDTLPTPNGFDQVVATFGNPTDRGWAAANIVKVSPIDPFLLFFQEDNNSLIPVSGIQIHRKLKDNLQSVLHEIWEAAKERVNGTATDAKVQRYLREHRLDQHSGSFVIRNMRGGRRLSMHSFGIAIDWDANNNPQGNPNSTLPDFWYEIWAKHGWIDGRHFRTPDPMHVQFAKGT